MGSMRSETLYRLVKGGGWNGDIEEIKIEGLNIMGNTSEKWRKLLVNLRILYFQQRFVKSTDNQVFLPSLTIFGIGWA